MMNMLDPTSDVNSNSNKPNECLGMEELKLEQQTQKQKQKYACWADVVRGKVLQKEEKSHKKGQNGSGTQTSDSDDSGYNSETSRESSRSPTKLNSSVFFPISTIDERDLFKIWGFRSCYASMTSKDIYDFVFKHLKLSNKECITNGYPYYEQYVTWRATVEETRYDTREKFVPSWLPIRTCCRCYRPFWMEEDGPEGICSYRKNGRNISTVHVTDQMPKFVIYDFVRADEPLGDNDPRSTEIYAIDCEMVYTVEGLALGRLSVVDFYGVLVLDVIVKPPTKVLDPNTQYSGLTLEQVDEAKDDLESCRLKLFGLINTKTLLVGHSLESDLISLRLVHENVVDTAIMYMRYGNKVSLRMLSFELLGKRIQTYNPATFGHNSAEDAEASLSLLKKKIQAMM